MHYDATALWKLIKDQGRTMTWLAKATEYDRTYVHLMRNGTKPVTQNFVEKASAALGVESSDLFVPIALTEVSDTRDEERVAD